MKVIAINGSPHQEGSTYTALTMIGEELAAQGIDFEILQVGSQAIQGCTGCNVCHKQGRCIYEDGVNTARAKIQEADGVILSAPTYYGGIAGGAKCFYDRLFYSGTKIRGKVASAVTVARRSGGEDVFHQLNSYLTLGGAVIAPTSYWNVIHGHNGAEIKQDAEGVAVLKIVGRTMSWLIKSLGATKEQYPCPDMNKGVATNFIR